MAEYFKEPQNPLKKIDETTGDITYVYPMTTAKQVIMDDDGTRLNTILNEHILYLGDAEDDVSVAPVDADTLGGYPAEYFLENAGGGSGDVTVNLDSAESSGQASTVDADSLGGVVASEYVKKSELDTSGMDLLWTNASPTSEFAAQTISLNLSEYNMVLVVASTDMNTTEYISNVGIKGFTMSLTCVEDSSHIWYREYTVNNNGIVFDIGKYTGNTNNNSVIPQKIYGIK